MFKTKSNQNENRKLTQKLQIAQNKNSLHLFILCMLVFRFFPCFANFCSLFFWGHFGGPVVCFQQFAVSFYFQQIFVIVVLLFPLLFNSFRSSGILIDRALLCNFYLHFALVSAQFTLCEISLGYDIDWKTLIARQGPPLSNINSRHLFLTSF